MKNHIIVSSQLEVQASVHQFLVFVTIYWVQVYNFFKSGRPFGSRVQGIVSKVKTSLF
jgi:hypothetical protein